MTVSRIVIFLEILSVHYLTANKIAPAPERRSRIGIKNTPKTVNLSSQRK